jgi:hypothetical protein
MIDDPEDEEWEEQDDSEDVDPLEFLSEEQADEELDKEYDVEEEDVDMPDADDNQQHIFSREETGHFWLTGILGDIDRNGPHGVFGGLIKDNDSMPAWYRGIPNHITPPDPDDLVDDMRPPFVPGRTEPVEPEELELGLESESPIDLNSRGPFAEHIAGPGCKNLHGYKGHEISVEEMRGCQTSQCLVRKPRGWTYDPLPDDEDFERNGEFFLSGLSDHMPSRDYASPVVTPERHGCREPHAENSMWDAGDAEEYAMPFHPPCFEVYKRASTLNSGRVDVTGLTSWWALEADYYFFDLFPRSSDIKKCARQEWEHHEGTAYLAANPLYVPTLERILQDSISTNPAFSLRSGAFTSPVAFAQQQTNDPFAALPAELQYQILDQLSSKDIAALRLSVRTFCQLPVSYFQKLLLREMPWLWEAWPTNARPCEMSYSKWATANAQKVNHMLQKPEQEAVILNDYVNIIKEEMPELESMLDEAFPVHLQAIHDAWLVESKETLVQDPSYLPPDRTDYFKLYTLLTRHWKELRGLQNRERIWIDCQEILRRIKEYKIEGRIDENGITEPLEDVIKGIRQRRPG